MRTRLATLAVTVALFGFASTAAEAALHAGDKIDITVYNHPELSAMRTIDADGNVAVPVVGRMTALNVEPDTLASRIQARLASYVRGVAVQVQLDAQTASVFVAGGPNGVIAYQPGMTLAAVVDRLTQQSTAAEPTDAANAQAVSNRSVQSGALDLNNGPIDFHRVTIVRDVTTLGPFDMIAMNRTGATGPALRPDDTIRLVDKPISVQVTGDVQKPGTAYLGIEEPLSQALTQVGGTAASSAENTLTLQRNGTATVVTLGSPEFSEPAHDGDVLVVPRATRVDVLGSVEKPGDTLLRGNSTLVGALYYAGGPAKYANLHAVTVVHGGVRTQYDLSRVQKGATGTNPQLVDGDTVFVAQGSTFDPSQIWNAIGAIGLFGLHI